MSDVRHQSDRGHAVAPVRAGSQVAHRVMIAAVALACASIAYAVHVRLMSAPADAAAAGGEVVAVGSPLDPAWSRCEPEVPSDGRTGFVRFLLGADDRLVGVQKADVFSDADGTPALPHAADLAPAQGAHGVDLRSWLGDVRPSGRHYLQFTLRVARDGALVDWCGWAPFEATDLTYACLVIHPRAGRTARVRVQTQAGQSIPGALVSLDPHPFPAGIVSTYVYTGDDGTRTVLGLDDVNYRARLAEGCGPYRQGVEGNLGHEAERVDLTVPLGGAWTFPTLRCDVRHAGASFRVSRLSTGTREVSRAWPVTTWIGPGRGDTVPLRIMTPRPADLAEPLRAELELVGFAPVGLSDARADTDLRFDLATSRIEVRSEREPGDVR